MNNTIYKKCADELFARLTMGLKSSDGSLHPQSLLCCLGSLCGYACREDVTDEYVKGKGLDEADVFDIIPSKSGEKFYFSQLADGKLAGDEHSVWGYISAVLVHEKAELPDIKEIFEHAVKSCGSADFGKVRNCQTGESIVEYVRLMWTAACGVTEGCPLGTRHAAFAMAAQKAMMAFRNVIPVTEQARIIMESAAAAAKIEI